MAPKLLVIMILLAKTSLLLVDASVAEEQDCSNEFEQQKRLEGCQEYIKYRTQVFIRYGVQSHDIPSDHHLQACCEQLQNMEAECRCDGLEKVVQEIPKKVEEIEEVAQAARNMPSICMMTPGRCVFSTPTPR